MRRPGQRLVAVAVVAAALTSACTTEGATDDRVRSTTTTEAAAAPETSMSDVGAGVGVDAPRYDGTITAVERPRPDSLAGLDAAGATVEITAQPAELPEPAIVELPAPGAAVGETVIVVTAAGPGGPWTPIEAEVANARARFTVEHFSWFAVVQVTRDFLERVVRETFEGFTSEVFTSTAQPACDGEGRARADGWDVTSSGPDTLKWCFGIDDAGRYVTVANNRRYPLTLSAAGRWSVEPAATPRSFESLSEAAEVRWGAAATVLGSQEEARFRIGELLPGTSGRLRTEYDGLTHVIGSMQYAAEALVAILSRFGLQPIRGGPKGLLAALVAARPCVDAIANADGPDSVSTIISRCFDAGTLTELLGSGVAGVLAGTVLAVGGFVSFLAQSASALYDTITGDDSYTVTIVRETPAPTPDVSAASEEEAIADWVRAEGAGHFVGLCPEDVVARPPSDDVCATFHGGEEPSYVWWVVKFGAGEPTWALWIGPADGGWKVLDDFEFPPIGEERDYPSWYP